MGRRVGFSLAELLLALALATITILTLMALSLSGLRSNRKSTDTVSGRLVAETRMQELIYAMQSGQGEGLWLHSASSPYSVDTVRLGNLDFQLVVYTSDPDPTLVAPNRLRNLEVRAEWMGGEGGASRAGMGRLQARCVRLVHEP